jgi:hypothetical protein
MVREGDGRRAVLGGPPAEAVDTARPVQQRILGVHVEMDELFQIVVSLT